MLLLDEIEKAHPDVFNILLQVMDYAVLTDNKGRKADCRHVVLIMTSNAGAQYARQASIGFNSQVTAGEAMLKQVKKTFKPESSTASLPRWSSMTWTARWHHLSSTRNSEN